VVSSSSVSVARTTVGSIGKFVRGRYRRVRADTGTAAWAAIAMSAANIEIV